VKFGLTLFVPLALLTFLAGPGVPTPQDPSQDPRFTVRMEPDPKGEFYGYVFTISNQSQTPITAVLIACDVAPTESGEARYSYRYEDNVFGMAEIPYQESTKMEVHHPKGWLEELFSCNRDSSVKAVLFADGSSFGEGEWTEKILRVRANALQTIAERMKYLQDAKNLGMTKGQLTDEVLRLSKQQDSNECLNFFPCGLGDPVSYANLWRSLPSDRNFPADGAISQALVDKLDEPYLDLRQRLIYSKPALPGIPQELDPAGAPSPDFVIKIAPVLAENPVLADDGDGIVVYYSLSAEGHQDKWDNIHLDPSDDPTTYSIHTLVGGQPATRLLAFLYIRGCQLKVIDLQDPSTSTGSDTFECVKPPMMNLKGRILPSELLEGRHYKVQARLLFPVTTGSVRFSIALVRDVTPDSNGFFQAELPDFSHIPGCSSSASCGGAVLEFSVKNGEAIIARLAASGNAANSQGDLHPMSDYGGVVNFTPRPFRE
jgi:hypothetical protein